MYSNKAPGIEDFEMSMYLNVAHIQIIDEYTAVFDIFEKYRSMLTGYIVDELIPGSLNDVKKNRGIDYQDFTLKNGCWRIIKELALTVSNPDGIDIKPIRYDDFNTASQNPYKRPNGLKGWRLDVNVNPATDSVRDVRIFFKKMTSDDYIKNYDVVYIMEPETFDMDADVVPDKLSANLFLMELVINRACELATRDYKENTLMTQIQTNNRTK